MQKICKCAIVNGVPTPEPGFAITGTITIRFPDGDGQAWFMTARTQAEADSPVPLVEVKDMTDAQVAADPLFPIIQRATKALRMFGPTSKRPILDATDKGFMYIDNTLNVTIWWYGTNWRDSAGVVK